MKYHFVNIHFISRLIHTGLCYPHEKKNPNANWISKNEMYCRKWAEQNRMGSQTRQTDKNLANELSISLLLSSMRNIIIMFPEAFGNCFMKNRKRNPKLYSPNACIQSIQSHRLHFYLNIGSNGILFFSLSQRLQFEWQQTNTFISIQH